MHAFITFFLTLTCLALYGRLMEVEHRCNSHISVTEQLFLKVADTFERKK